MPSKGRGYCILRIDEDLEALRRYLTSNGQNQVLLICLTHKQHREYGQTDRELVYEVGNRTELARMGVDECLNPCAGFIVLYLDYVREHCRTIRKGEEFNGGWVTVVFPIDEFFRFGYGIVNGDTRLGRGYSSYGGATYQQQDNITETSHCLLGFTKEVPNATTLFSRLNAIFATAFANGTPSFKRMSVVDVLS